MSGPSRGRVPAAFLTLLGASVLFLGACAERDPLSPAAPSFDFHGGGGQHERGDCWGRGHGRSGEAALTVDAVYGRDGTTEITVTSYAASDTGFTTPAGCILLVDVRASADARGPWRWGGAGRDHRASWRRGDEHWVRTWGRHADDLHTGSVYVVRAPGLHPGMKIDVEAVVGCLGRRGGDRVTVEAVVVRRTDPAVTALSVPAQAPVSLPLLVAATIKELNGDQGAAGTCYLLVGGTATDSLTGVHVAPGDSTPCNFAPTFTTTGTRRITVTYGNVTPKDDDPANNSRSASLEIVAGGAVVVVPPQPFIISANVYDDTAVDYSDVFFMSQRLASDPTVLRDTTAFRTTAVGNVQSASFTGMIYEAVPFPLVSLTVSQASGSTTYHSASWTNLAANATAGANAQCAILPSGAVSLALCSYQPDASFPAGRTTLSYVRADSNVTGRLSAYFVDWTTGTASACDPTSTDMTQPCFTVVTSPKPSPLPHYQASYTFSVVIETATRKYTAQVAIPMVEGLLDETEPYACTDQTVTGGDFVTVLQHTCLGTTDVRWRKGGHVDDLVALTQAK